MSSAKFLLYTAKVCPYAARAELALALAGIQHETFEVDLMNKPDWYNEKVNAASKVPVLVTNPESSTEFKLPESLVIVEYIHDLTSTPNSSIIFPSSSTPESRAISRYIVERYMQLVQPHYISTALRGESSALALLRQGLVEFNSLLKTFDSVEKSGDFIQAENVFSYADLNIAPFIARILSASKHDILPNPNHAINKIHQDVQQGTHGFERIQKWWNAVQNLDVWKNVWIEQAYLEPARKMIAKRNATQQQQQQAN
ncbi:uncharacterized protein UTRI_05696 [Ustilago trichophora]|uniref:Glutathione S-transferase n=1 Tax=Ustilago trichophora TaxID=86804 RepID=A0A5C3EII0_9BASI|nr:uncharacterized protein UTRI_05696 [Ustilago trichophora]